LNQELLKAYKDRFEGDPQKKVFPLGPNKFDASLKIERIPMRKRTLSKEVAAEVNKTRGECYEFLKLLSRYR